MANPDGGVGTCVAESATGSACAAGTYPCAGGGYCVFGDSAHDDGGTCAAIVAPGGKCTPSATATPTCPPGALCIDADGGADSYCTALPGDGQPCLGSASAATTYCDERVACATIPDSGPTGTCVGHMLGGQAGDSCGTDVCTTCAPGENCGSGKCAVATLHCE